MTEREKMLAGELYDCGDPELLTNKKRLHFGGAFFCYFQTSCQSDFSQVHILNLAATDSHLG